MTDSDLKNNMEDTTLDNSLNLESSLQREDSIKSSGNSLKDKEKEKEKEKENNTSQQLIHNPIKSQKKK